MKNHSVRNRTILILVVVFSCLFGVIGFPSNVQQLRQNIADRVKLGLDLAGGTHLVLQVQVNDALNVTTDLALERLRDDMRAKNIPFADIQKTDMTHILIKGVPQQHSGDVDAIVRDGFSGWTLEQVPGDPTSRQLVMRVTEAANLKNEAFTQARETIYRRINALGVTEPEVADYGQGDYELVVQLPGVNDPSHVKDVIQQTAMLELKIVVDGPYPTQDAALAAHGGVLPPNTQLLPGTNDNGGGAAWYIVNSIAAVTGRDLSGAEPSQDENGRPDINFTLTRDGATRFAQITQRNIGKQLAIVLDGHIASAPVIRGQISDRGEISGSFTVQQASDLALTLRSGALPASIKYLQEETIGPSLGADSIRHGVIACIVGFIAVIGFMLIYYKEAGINADVALTMNLLILIAALAYFGAVLTLPGIAGVILTVGMGVDSNVLVFERIREEIRLGKSVPAAVAGGFQHAFRTILDTHVTTVVSAAILFTFGTGPIRGFAVTLTIGLIANIFTSVFVSRVIFDYHLEHRVRDQALSI